MNQKEKRITKLISDQIKILDPTAEIFLYGSHARGTATDSSDWDILILLQDTTVSLQTEQRFRHQLLDIELNIGEPISVYVKSKQDWETKYSITSFYKNIASEGLKVS